MMTAITTRSSIRFAVDMTKYYARQACVAHHWESLEINLLFPRFRGGRSILFDMKIFDWRWTPVQVRMPADGQTLAIKFSDANDAVRYGIGWYNAREERWVVTAEPNMFNGSLEPIEWVALPD